MTSKGIFPNYMQMQRRMPLAGWHALRILSVGWALGLCLVLFMQPALGLFVVWRVIVPLLPLAFFIVPGLWRNVCPLAAMNQTPRIFQFTRALTAPRWLQQYGYVIGITLFVVIVSSRKVLFNTNGPALGLLILLLLSAAFTMGIFFKGKSGWCSSICPLLPVQRIYGQTPFVTVPNSHCQPCVGCTKNCYDFNPRVAYLADLYDSDRHFAGYRKYFVGLFPGFILAFYTLPDPPAIPVWQMYLQFAVYSFASAGSFFLLDSFLKVTSNKLTVLYGALALNLYYWFNTPGLAALAGPALAMGVTWTLRAVVLLLTLVWIRRTYQKEPLFLELAAASSVARAGTNESIVAHHATQFGNPEVVFEPEGKRVVVKPGRTLLEVVESNGLPIEPGCRMGICGADPVCILDGMDHLSKISDDERTTLERLGLAANTRMACVARVKGNVKLSLTPEKPPVFSSSVVAGFRYDRTVTKVVIIGNGIAGVTAADHVRRRHPHCEIHLVGRESHHLYNRMAITRLIYGRTAMQGLYLLPDKWYDDYHITSWLNTHVTGVDTSAQTVHLGTGEQLRYDRLILTMGSRSWVPPIEGYGIAGVFVLREAADAIAIRTFLQEQRCRTAVVAGGGLLGLEAAYALQKVGLQVTVLERSKALLSRQLDARGAQFLQAYLEGLGIEILTEAETAAVHGNERLTQATLKDGRTVPCDLLLVCAGIRSNLQLAQEMGLKLAQGIVVDDHMRTSVPNIYAAGDLAEYNGRVLGLWPVAVSQAEVAAVNAVGGDAVYSEVAPVTMLKVAGVDLTSIGRFQPEGDADMVIALEEAQQRYRKLIVRNGKVIGAILLGYPQDAPGVAEAVKRSVDVSPHIPKLQQGDWSSFSELVG